MGQLARKKVSWKKVMLFAPQSARSRLSEYYRKTDEIDGDFYAIGTIPAPQNKLEFSSTKDWAPHWRVRCRKSLEEYLTPYQQRYSETQSTSDARSSIGESLKLIFLWHQLHLYGRKQLLMTNFHGIWEVISYIPFPLTSLLLISIGTQLVDPRIYWGDHQHEYPILASLTRDVLTTPASGSGVERLFNSAHDICH